MVKLCSYNYPKENEAMYQPYYEKYPYELHDFQKWCVEGIVTGNHVLICCPTGSGKTFGGEFAIDYFQSKGKKVIYTTPIKALSNEKFYNFTHKYPHIRIGILTGDLKCNPDADVLIMTTEILLNKLYQLKCDTPTTASSFDMDIENDLGCVIFDEIHFINDESRGHVWEQTIMMLPHHIQMVGLSATLDNPERFAQWLETRGQTMQTVQKEVFLTRKLTRAVPLIHYAFITVPNAINKVVKDKAIQQEIQKIINKPLVLQNEKGVFQDANYQLIQNKLNLFEKHNLKVKRKFILNTLCEHLVEQEMLPALCYVFSRKQIEVCADEITTNLLEFDSKVPYIVDDECEKIIRKLPNYQEYLQLPEYVKMVALLRKGIGIHHAGSMSILREITELMFARGFIKLLFCTETMSVGINLPVKTTIFTDIHKFNGNFRTLYSHEYTQAAGRAGRLGLDKVGHVIHLNNLFRNVDSITYKTMMNGKPFALVSKFKLSCNLMLNLLDTGTTDVVQFVKQSMIMGNILDKLKPIEETIRRLNAELTDLRNKIQYMRTPTDVLTSYIELRDKQRTAINKERKAIERKLSSMVEEHKHIEKDRETYATLRLKEEQLHIKEGQYTVLHNGQCLQFDVEKALSFLTDEKCIEQIDGTPRLTLIGRIASQLREVPCVVFAQLYNAQVLQSLTPTQLVCLFSCFTTVRVQEENIDRVPKSTNESLNTILLNIHKRYQEFHEKECDFRMNDNTEVEYNMHYDLLNYVATWCESTDVEHCKYLLQTMADEKQIFLGDFVKALLKINNISAEFEKIAEMTGNITFLNTLKQIPVITLKYVVTNQSLYV
jgi:superfamily II RNA helicase